MIKRISIAVGDEVLIRGTFLRGVVRALRWEGTALFAAVAPVLGSYLPAEVDFNVHSLDKLSGRPCMEYETYGD